MSDKQSHVTPFLSTTKKKTNLPGFRGLVKKTKKTWRRGRTEIIPKFLLILTLKNDRAWYVQQTEQHSNALPFNHEEEDQPSRLSRF
jgi:hypothetical protein